MLKLPRWAHSVALLVVAVALLGASDPEARFQKIGHEMICSCGCGQILLECNHVSCPSSPVMIGELREQVSQSGPDTLILNWFAAKYGATILAAPMRGGFDDVAWITPMAVFLLATLGVAFLIKVWKLRGERAPALAGAPSGGLSTESTALRERIRRETEY